MRVNLTYSVPLNEVETHVAGLIKDSGTKIENIGIALKKMASLLESGQGNLILAELDQIRRNMSKVDLRLMDCASIMDSYGHTLEQLEEQQANLQEPAFEHSEEIKDDEER